MISAIGAGAFIAGALGTTSGLAQPSLPAIITACAATLTAIGGLIVAFTLLLPILRQTKETHKIVNQQQTDLRNYQRALIEALKEAHIQVPDDQSRGSAPSP